MFDYSNYILESENIDEDGRPVFHVRAKLLEDWHCPNCGHKKIRVRGTCPRKVFDLTPSGDKAIIEITERKYICPECHKAYNPYFVDSEETFSRDLRDYMAREGILNGAKGVSEKIKVGRPVVQREIDRLVVEYDKGRTVTPPSVAMIDSLKIRQHHRYVVYDAGREQIVEIFPDREAMVQAIRDWKPVTILSGSEFLEETMDIAEASEKEAEKLGISVENWREMVQGNPNLTEIKGYGTQALQLFAVTHDLMDGKEADPVMLKQFPAFGQVSLTESVDMSVDQNNTDLNSKEAEYQLNCFKKWLSETRKTVDYRARFDVERVRILMTEDIRKMNQ